MPRHVRGHAAQEVAPQSSAGEHTLEEGADLSVLLRVPGDLDVVVAGGHRDHVLGPALPELSLVHVVHPVLETDEVRVAVERALELVPVKEVARLPHHVLLEPRGLQVLAHLAVLARFLARLLDRRLVGKGAGQNRGRPLFEHLVDARAQRGPHLHRLCRAVPPVLAEPVPLASAHQRHARVPVLELLVNDGRHIEVAHGGDGALDQVVVAHALDLRVLLRTVLLRPQVQRPYAQAMLVGVMRPQRLALPELVLRRLLRESDPLVEQVVVDVPQAPAHAHPRVVRVRARRGQQSRQLPGQLYVRR